MKIVSKSYKVAVIAWLCLCAAGFVFQSCEKDNDGGFRLDAYGPCRIERGDTILFVGNGLDKVEQIIFLDVAKEDGEEGREIITLKKGVDFTATSEKITLHIPDDYPLDRIALAKLICSDGREHITTSVFMIWNEVTVAGFDMEDQDLMDKDHPLEPGKWISIKGKLLLEVDSVVFDNGVRIYKDEFIEFTDQILKFTLPDNVGSGCKFSLKVGRYDSSVDVGEVFVPVAGVKKFSPNNGVALSVCSDQLVINVDRFDRLDYDKGKMETTVVIASQELKGKVNEANQTIVVSSLPRSFSPDESYKVKLPSIGKLFESKETFTVDTTVIDVEDSHTYDITITSTAPNDGNWITFSLQVFGKKNMCTVEKVLYTSSTGDGTAVVKEADRTSNGFKVSIIRYLKESKKLTIVLFSGEKIELPIPY